MFTLPFTHAEWWQSIKNLCFRTLKQEWEQWQGNVCLTGLFFHWKVNLARVTRSIETIVANGPGVQANLYKIKREK